MVNRRVPEAGTPINWERIWGWRQEVSTYSLISFFNYIFPCFHSFQFDKLTGWFEITAKESSFLF